MIPAGEMNVPQDGLILLYTPVAVCIAPNSSAGCYSTNFSTFSIPYSKVCGMAVGYQMDSADAFGFITSINGPYVDGISITYGIPRKHIWTYAIGGSDRSDIEKRNCPCSEFSGRLPPSFVHDNYYCESGTMLDGKGVFTDDPVWDGEGCSDGNSCCSDPSLPWFYRQLPLTASEDIETRICRKGKQDDENILVKELQLYVK